MNDQLSTGNRREKIFHRNHDHDSLHLMLHRPSPDFHRYNSQRHNDSIMLDNLCVVDTRARITIRILEACGIAGVYYSGDNFDFFQFICECKSVTYVGEGNEGWCSIGYECNCVSCWIYCCGGNLQTSRVWSGIVCCRRDILFNRIGMELVKASVLL